MNNFFVVWEELYLTLMKCVLFFQQLRELLFQCGFDVPQVLLSSGRLTFLFPFEKLSCSELAFTLNTSTRGEEIYVAVGKISVLPQSTEVATLTEKKLVNKSEQTNSVKSASSWGCCSQVQLCKLNASECILFFI